MRALLANNAATTLAAAITTTGATSLTVVSAVGFPAPAVGQYFFAQLLDASNIPELVKVTNVTSNTFTIVRAQESTSARTFISGSKVALVITAGTLNELVPADGTGATGTWGIGISGNAATATTAASCSGNALTATSAATAGSAPASDVSSWAKAGTKPAYTKAEVGLSNVDNTADSAKSVSYSASAGSAPSSAGSAVFASSGSWTCPVGITSVYATGLGGGGGAGAGSGPFGSAGSDGAAGGSASRKKVAVTPGANYTITIGAGGGIGLNGSAGGSTSFGALLTIPGGGGGGPPASGVAAVPGTSIGAFFPGYLSGANLTAGAPGYGVSNGYGTSGVSGILILEW